MYLSILVLQGLKERMSKERDQKGRTVGKNEVDGDGWRWRNARIASKDK